MTTDFVSRVAVVNRTPSHRARVASRRQHVASHRGTDRETCRSLTDRAIAHTTTNPNEPEASGLSAPIDPVNQVSHYTRSDDASFQNLESLNRLRQSSASDLGGV